ncbi:hypothetical protein ACOME3_006200 [Neoechinorhynchus agilis]
MYRRTVEKKRISDEDLSKTLQQPLNRASPTLSHASASRISHLVGTGFAMAVKMLHPQGRNENECQLLSDDMDRRRVCQLGELVETTKFTKQEIKRLYRDFKQEFPKGYADKEQLSGLFGRIFPHGNSQAFAAYILNSINKEKQGTVVFSDFLQMLSTILRGTLREKIEWIFDFYTQSTESLTINRETVIPLFRATYELLGEQVYEPAIAEEELKMIGRRFLLEFDQENSGELTKEQFIEALLQVNIFISVEDSVDLGF